VEIRLGSQTKKAATKLRLL